MTTTKRRSPAAHTSWDPVARWYDGWMGAGGSKHHRALAIPAVLELLRPQPGESILDLGAGQGVLAPSVAAAGARYVGVDASPQLLRLARQRHGGRGAFLLGDTRRLHTIPDLRPASFDAAVFLLSIQDMDPLDPVVAGVDWALRPGGRVVLLMTHPCFRVPRQSGWGWDHGRKLRFRRIDRYLTSLAVPMKAYGGERRGATRSFHRPLHAYVNALAEHNLLIDALHEIAGPAPDRDRDEGSDEIPLFLALRAIKFAA
jgi:SAM-dependent methyltransferase